MIDKLVKRMIQQRYIQEDLLFVIEGSDKKFTLNEILELKDQDWIRRSVAYSEECSRQVVKESLSILEEKRKTGVPHKILASACSIAHAEQIKKLYEDEGKDRDIHATIIHSDLTQEERDNNRRDFERDRNQVIVHVSMLGEGYNHPEISIIAMFKPYRSLNEYVQLAGRALRKIRYSQNDDVDNTAHLVYHKELGLESLWEYYRKEIRRAEIIEQIEEAQSLDQVEDEIIERKTAGHYVPDIGMVEEVGTGIIVRDSFLDDYDIIASYDKAKMALDDKVKDVLSKIRESGIEPTPEMEEVLLASIRKDVLKSKRPDLELEDMRKEFKNYIEDSIADILERNKIDPKSTEEFGIFRENPSNSWIKANANDGFLVSMINNQLKTYIGRSRKEWTVSDYQQAYQKLDDILRLIEKSASEEVA